MQLQSERRSLHWTDKAKGRAQRPVTEGHGRNLSPARIKKRRLTQKYCTARARTAADRADRMSSAGARGSALTFQTVQASMVGVTFALAEHNRTQTEAQALLLSAANADRRACNSHATSSDRAVEGVPVVEPTRAPHLHTVKTDPDTASGMAAHRTWRVPSGRQSHPSPQMCSIIPARARTEGFAAEDAGAVAGGAGSAVQQPMFKPGRAVAVVDQIPYRNPKLT